MGSEASPTWSKAVEEGGKEFEFTWTAGSLGSGSVAGRGAGGRSFSLFFSSVRKNAFRVVLRALFGLHRSEERGVCAQTGQHSGREPWPM